MKSLSLLLVGAAFNAQAAISQHIYGDTVSMDITYRIHSASWYELPNWSDPNGLPKYTGALGTYTAKHIPIAVKSGNKEYYIFSENSAGSLKIYAADNQGNKTLVRTISGVIDPHDNAVINVKDGYVYVLAAARGTSRIGYMYKSTKPNDISSFEQVDSDYWAYPHLWPNALLYTRYNPNYYTHTNSSARELYAKTDVCDKKLVEGGHYSISYYDGQTYHLAYNWHDNGNLDHRRNLYYMRSSDGCHWENRYGTRLSLPLEEDSPLTRILSSGSDLMYMKDIHVNNGKVEILAVRATSENPSMGSRYLAKYNTNGNGTFITNVGHNYTTGAFVSNGQTNYIVTPTFGTDLGYAGGDLEVFTLNGAKELKANFKYQYNYVRKIINGSGAYVSEAPSNKVNQGAYVRRIGLHPY